MNMIKNLSAVAALTFISVSNVFATTYTPRPVPEMDASIAVLGLGLLAGVLGLVSEYRRKK
ncbi:hypothetical protein [Methylocucumis oryzae]|uniref:VPEID-CTERM protein sorting domain-containing protein n=1 Tax=Methylocucumis oryzae TaxID=1632867 RepID=A0A0F3IFN1_9GAMM|nr:hypothetical protein [Methylocucumis oryzae]KJV05353.1 hypothetical protein VZ94_18810 [Methylocucumis oryzae]